MSSRLRWVPPGTSAVESGEDTETGAETDPDRSNGACEPDVAERYLVQDPGPAGSVARMEVGPGAPGICAMREVNEAVLATYLAGGNTRQLKGALRPLLKACRFQEAPCPGWWGALKATSKYGERNPSPS